VEEEELVQSTSSEVEKVWGKTIDTKTVNKRQGGGGGETEGFSDFIGARGGGRGGGERGGEGHRRSKAIGGPPSLSPEGHRRSSKSVTSSSSNLPPPLPPPPPAAQSSPRVKKAIDEDSHWQKLFDGHKDWAWKI
jgi:hypothetical protein